MKAFGVVPHAFPCTERHKNTQEFPPVPFGVPEVGGGDGGGGGLGEGA